MRLSATRRRRAALVAGLLAVTTGCSSVSDVLGGGDPVLDTGIEPVALDFDGPTYAARDGRDLLVRNGDDELRVRGRAEGWLPDGRLLVARGRGTAVVDPAQGEVATGPYLGDSGRAVTQVNRLTGGGDRVRLRTYDLGLNPLETHVLPPTDNPDATAYNELARTYYGAVPTIDGVTFVKWHDGSEWYEDGDYGVLRIEGDEQENVLPNSNVVGLYLSADGTGLIGLRQTRGDPCGGCVVEQDIVEIDPVTGEIGAEYGVPDEYTEDWRIGAIDKVGDRVAVRYYDAVQTGARFVYEQRGTWVYDGGWTMVDGSEDELTWWQGEGRIVARTDPTEKRRGDGWDLFWVVGDEETPLPGELSTYPQAVPTDGSVAGQLLPPDGG